MEDQEETVSESQLEEVSSNESEVDAQNSITVTPEESASQNKEEDSSPKEKVVSFKDFSKEKSSLEEKEIEPSEEKPKPKVSRDFSGIEEADRAYFQKMGNESFAFQKKLYLENKEQKTKLEEFEKKSKEVPAPTSNLPPSYYAHPRAYTLTPEFQDLNNAAAQADFIRKHWAQQKALITRGQKWKELTGFDKNGPVYGSEQEPTAEAEISVEEYLEFAREQSVRIKTDLDGFVKNFTSKHKEAEQEIELVRNKFFKDMDTDEHPTRKLQNQVIENLPQAYKDHPLAKIVALLTAANAQLNGKLQELQGKKIIEDKNKQDATKAQPSKKVFQSGSSDSNGKVKFSDFKALREVEV